jgi:D-alanyl-lipoteichoic acid acyltransferase DltB (MBOAT superfamily)
MYFFLLTTMLVGGFWHGADWRFVFWGFAHGLALIVHKIWSRFTISNKSNWYYNLIGVFITFNFVSLCWIFFRAESFNLAFESINEMVLNTSLKDCYGFLFSRKEVCIVLIIATIIVFFPAQLKNKFFSILQRMPTFTWIIWFAIALQIIIQFKDEIVQPFIYFQF